MSHVRFYLVFNIYGGFAFVAYQRYALNTAAMILGATMLIGTIFGSIGLLGWLLFAAVIVPVVYKPFRIDFLSSKILGFYKSVTPELSETEQEAIDAGTVWWDGDLFSG